MKLVASPVADPLAQLDFEQLEVLLTAAEESIERIEKEGLPISGVAGGVLKGEYPNPEFAADMATQAELDAEIKSEKETREAKDKEEKEAREAADALKASKAELGTEKSERETADGLKASKVELGTEKTEREAKDKEEKETRESKDKNEKEEREAADSERVVGPASATASDVAIFNGTTGKIVKDGGKTVAQLLDRANHTGTQTASTISDLASVVKAYRLDEFAKPTSNVSVNNKKIIELANPTEELDAANKLYVDTAAAAAAAGLQLKNPVSYASTANVTVTTETPTTLEGTCPLTIDGKSGFAAGTRILLKDQTTGKQNGIYTVTKDESFGGTGTYGGEGKFAEGEKWLLTRATDADTESEVQQGMYVSVVNGTTNAGSAWVLQTENPVIPGTTAMVFVRFTSSPVGVAGGDLAGTYPNPTIGLGKVEKEKLAEKAVETKHFAAGAKAPDADKLDGIDSTGFMLSAVSLGTWFAVPNFGNNAEVAATAERMYYAQIIIIGEPTLTGICYFIGAAKAGNVRAALYNSAGTRVANRSTALEVGAISTLQKVPFTETFKPTSGVYFVALIFTSATTKFAATLALSPSGFVAGPGSGATATSITPPTELLNANIPTMTTY